MQWTQINTGSRYIQYHVCFLLVGCGASNIVTPVFIIWVPESSVREVQLTVHWHGAFVFVCFLGGGGMTLLSYLLAPVKLDFSTDLLSPGLWKGCNLKQLAMQKEKRVQVFCVKYSLTWNLSLHNMMHDKINYGFLCLYSFCFIFDSEIPTTFLFFGMVCVCVNED